MTEQEIKSRILKMSQMDEEEWESLCKCCGICCLLKHTRREGTYYTGVACNNLDLSTKRCSIYSTRLKHAISCRKVDLPVVLRSGLLPDSCGYIEYIYGKADKDVSMDFRKILNERDLTKPQADLSKLEFNSNPVSINTRYCTVPGPWDFIIKESLNWRSRSIELRDKYAEFGHKLLQQIQGGRSK